MALKSYKNVVMLALFTICAVSAHAKPRLNGIKIAVDSLAPPPHRHDSRRRR